MQLGPGLRSLDQPHHPCLPYGSRNEAVAAMLPNKRLKLAALLLSEAQSRCLRGPGRSHGSARREADVPLEIPSHRRSGYGKPVALSRQHLDELEAPG
jgi:hypothetical protein